MSSDDDEDDDSETEHRQDGEMGSDMSDFEPSRVDSSSSTTRPSKEKKKAEGPTQAEIDSVGMFLLSDLLESMVSVSFFYFYFRYYGGILLKVKKTFTSYCPSRT